MERQIAGEQKEYAELRRSIMKALDWAHFRKQISWLKDFARQINVRDDIVIGRWEEKGCDDVTTEEGRRRFQQDWDAYWWVDNL